MQSAPAPYAPRTRFGFHPRIKVIGLTGGPSSGKTTLLAVAKQWLEDRGFKVVILSETATEFGSSGFPLFPKYWQGPLDLQRFILARLLFLEDLYHEMCERLETVKPIVLIIDRPSLDGMAYAGRHSFLKALEMTHLDLHELRERYAAIIHCETAAASEGYTTENNPNRSESAMQALELDHKTFGAWLGHQHLIRIPARESFTAKKLDFLQSLSRILEMPEPYEIERKWRVDNFHLSMIPAHAGKVQIYQTYLKAPTGCEHRVRMRESDGSSSYYETKKYPTMSTKKRIEQEHQIVRSRYEELLLIADPERASIRKVRASWEFDNRTLEFDVFADVVRDGQPLALAEVEIPTEDTIVNLPPEWNVVEVTNDRDYKNSSIARLIQIGDASRLVKNLALPSPRV